jgi:hypothetical protein
MIVDFTRNNVLMSILSDIQIKASLQMAVLIGVLFLCVQIALTITAPTFASHRMYSCFILSLIGLVSGCAGWASGMFLSPIGSQINGAQKVLAGLTVFWSGVIVSHLQQLSGLFDAWQKSPTTSATKIELLFGTGIFLFALCVTFNTRIDQA